MVYKPILKKEHYSLQVHDAKASNRVACPFGERDLKIKECFNSGGLPPCKYFNALISVQNPLNTGVKMFVQCKKNKEQAISKKYVFTEQEFFKQKEKRFERLFVKLDEKNKEFR